MSRLDPASALDFDLCPRTSATSCSASGSGEVVSLLPEEGGIPRKTLCCSS